MIDWLLTNSNEMNIEKWFSFRDCKDVTQAPFGVPYAGINFFESELDRTSLNQSGRVYRNYATGRR